ncbi:MAG: UrcA family protein [Porphyrobacter sp.]|nr:UrcA family protein [Porphyrobacter sp.]
MTVISALLVLSTLTVPAVATAAPGQQSAAIEVGDLVLDTPKGQRLLALRIQRASRAMCKTEALASLPRNIRSERKCIREAHASALLAIRSLKRSEGQ